MSLVDEILKSRGYTKREIREAFLHPSYEVERHDPFLLPDMQKAVDRIISAKDKNETVVIYGDYDIDGLTASTVLLDSLEKFGLNVSVFIPNRFVDGYGLSGPALEILAENGAQLVITVDCGSLSHKEVELANSLGVDVIVTDHHSVAETMPDAVAVINPKRLLAEHPEAYQGFELKSTIDDSRLIAEQPHGKRPTSNVQRLYPLVDLAGVGVAFKLVQALQTKLEGLPEGHEKWLLDLVALGTVCDVVELKGENRANVYWGLEVMRKTRRIGLKMLMAVARIEPDKLNARALGFGLGPRLNASGRLETAQIALDLLTETDRKKALELASRLDVMNLARRADQDRIVKHASEKVLQLEKDSVLVVSDPSWSHGIIGIVAAKLLETHHKPAFVLQELEDGTAKGSARSFGDFSAVDAIRATETLLIKGGGHRLAAGVTIETTKIAEWREAMNAFYRSLKLEKQERYLEAKADVTVESFGGMDEALLQELASLEPYGNGNPEPVFCVRGVSVSGRRTMGEGGKHVAYVFSDHRGKTMKMNAWNASREFVAEAGEVVDVWFELTLNEWQGRRNVEGRLLRLMVADL